MESDDNRWEGDCLAHREESESLFRHEKLNDETKDISYRNSKNEDPPSSLESGIGCLGFVGISLGFLYSAGYVVYRLTQV